MRFTARFFSRFIVSILLFAFLLPVFTTAASAQTVYPNSFARPNVEANVEQNQHTYFQNMFIEMILAMQCQLTGIDITNPTQPCLGINLETGKLGYAPTNPDGLPPIGGVLGMLNSAVGATYIRSYTTEDYVSYMAGNFGIPKTYAAPTQAFDGFQPILGLWKMMRDIAYFLLTIAFIFIGIGVMLRIHIDPRTVMTVQNQIPRVIICIILITFSYAFAALLADTMWVVTYMGINKLTDAAVDPAAYNVCGWSDKSMTLSRYATSEIIQTPIGFVDDIFFSGTCGPFRSGIVDMSKTVALNLSAIEWNLFLQAIGISDKSPLCTPESAIGAVTLTNPITAMPTIVLDRMINDGDIVKSTAKCLIGFAFGNVIKYFTNIAWFLIVMIIVVVTLFRIWFELLKAYIMVLLYVIVAPIWIVFGLLPKKPLGFEKWLRAYFAHLAVFPATVFLLISARLFYELFNSRPDSVFVPPLVGNPYAGNFGAILLFGMLLMCPTLLSIIREKIGSQPLKQAQAIGAGITAGRQAAGAIAGKATAPLNRYSANGLPEGPAAVLATNAKAGGMRFLFDKDHGVFASKGPNQNLIQKYLGNAANRATKRAEGDPYWRESSGAPRSSHPRENPANKEQVKQVDEIMAKDPRARNVADEQALENLHDLLSDVQHGKRAGERLALDLTIKTSHGETTIPLRDNTDVAETFVLGKMDESTADGAAAAASLRAESGRAGGEHWNKSLKDLTPLERAKVQEFLSSNAKHMK